MEAFKHFGALLALILWPQIFEQRLDLNLKDPEKFTTKRWLKKGSIPSVDCIILKPQVQEISARERRQVICIKCLSCAIDAAS